MRTLLIVDDDEAIRRSLAISFRKKFQILEAATGNEALEAVRETPIDIVLLDQRLPDADGTEVLREIKKLSPQVPVIMLTAYGTVKSSVKAMKLGAFDYIEKPYDIEEVKLTVANALKLRTLEEEVNQLRLELKEKYALSGIIGKSKAMQDVFRLIKDIAPLDITVLITGETGTGKELVARAIHYNSARANGPFVAVNCAAIPENLLESELFGYEKGAFTGAVKRKKGKIELAEGGTLFLDEIGDMPSELQAKLLRFLEDRTFERLGGEQTIKANVRIVAATNHDLTLDIKEKRFREDLYFRLNTITIYLPPLRKRWEDVPLLVEHFIQAYNESFKKNIKGISPEALSLLIQQEWPGNVRELKHVIARAVALCRGEMITPKDLALETKEALGEEIYDLNRILERHEKAAIRKALMQTGYNKTKAAQLLGISLRSLQYKIKKYGL